MNERGLQTKSDSNYRVWEGGGNSEFPTLCEYCMGDSPYTRMLKNTLASKCKMCDRPFTGTQSNPITIQSAISFALFLII